LFDVVLRLRWSEYVGPVCPEDAEVFDVAEPECAVVLDVAADAADAPDVSRECRAVSDEAGERAVGDDGDGSVEGEVGRECGEWVMSGSGGESSEVDETTWTISVSIWGELVLCKSVVKLTRLTIRRRFPWNTSPASTQRFHAHSIPCKTKYPTTPTHRTGLDSSNGTRKEYSTEPSEKMIDVYPSERCTVGWRREGVNDWAVRYCRQPCA
jgi:hypothetical protein